MLLFTVGAIALVATSGPAQVLAQARKRVDLEITLDDLTAARLIASELSSGTESELAALCDAEVNRAARKRISSVGRYGKQGGRHLNGKRHPASTRRDPTREHLQVARAVLGWEMQGLSLGAVRSFDHVSQWKAHRKWSTGKSDRRHCHPAVILERWTHDKKWNKRGPPCALCDQSGRHSQEWVGPIDGINPGKRHESAIRHPRHRGPHHRRVHPERR